MSTLVTLELSPRGGGGQFGNEHALSWFGGRCCMTRGTRKSVAEGKRAKQEMGGWPLVERGHLSVRMSLGRGRQSCRGCWWERASHASEGMRSRAGGRVGEVGSEHRARVGPPLNPSERRSRPKPQACDTPDTLAPGFASLVEGRSAPPSGPRTLRSRGRESASGGQRR